MYRIASQSFLNNVDRQPQIALSGLLDDVKRLKSKEETIHIPNTGNACSSIYTLNGSSEFVGSGGFVTMGNDLKKGYFLTAAHCVFGSGDITGQTLLISGGAGTVAHNAVQLAKWGGAKVIVTAAPDGFDRVRAAGADAVFDYASPDLVAQINECTQGAGVDRAVEVEFGRNADLLGQVVKTNGTIAAYGSALDMSPNFSFGAYLFRAITLDIVLIYCLPWEQRKIAIERLHSAFLDGALRPDIHARFALSDCQAAHAAVEAGKRTGAVLLQVDAG